MEAFDARSLMRSVGDCAHSPGRVAALLGTSRQTAADVLVRLADEGLAEPWAREGRYRVADDEDGYLPSGAGRSPRLVSGGR